MTRRLLLVRHGVTTWNREGRFQGRLDPPLDPLGELEAAYLAERLAEEAGLPPRIVSSPLQRAAATARILAARLGVGAPELDEGLVEIGAGAWEGRTHAELSADDGPRYAAWRTSGGEIEPPGAEPLEIARERVGSCVDALLAQAAGDDETSMLLVSHGGILRLAAGHLLGLPTAQVWDWEVHNASLSTVARDAADDWQVVGWNDVNHLHGRPDLDRDEADGQPLIL